MTSYRETLQYLYKLQQRGWKLGLRNVKAILNSLDHPENSFPSIHIAGTNGKGSTASFLASVFMEGGYKTALYTSPHLIRFTERIRINGHEIPEARLVKYVEEIRPLIDRWNATFFEATTCIAFRYFAEEGVDIAVIETGLGGRLDATNVLTPLVSVITNVSLEHMEYLGDTISKIAREKGGIIKQVVPVVTGVESDEALKVLRRIADRRKAHLFKASDIVRLGPVRDMGSRENVAFRAHHLEIHDVRLGLAGSHQIWNARLAGAALSILLRSKSFHRRFPGITARAVREGLKHVRANVHLEGRMQRLGKNGQFMLDVAHNPEGVRTSVRALEEMGEGDLAVVFGVLKDKEVVPMLKELGRITHLLVAVRPRSERGRTAESVYRLALRAGIPSRRARSVSEALRIAERKGKVLVTGSHYLVGEVLEILRRRGLL